MSVDQDVGGEWEGVHDHAVGRVSSLRTVFTKNSGVLNGSLDKTQLDGVSQQRGLVRLVAPDENIVPADAAPDLNGVRDFPFTVDYHNELGIPTGVKEVYQGRLYGRGDNMRIAGECFDPTAPALKHSFILQKCKPQKAQAPQSELATVGVGRGLSLRLFRDVPDPWV